MNKIEGDITTCTSGIVVHGCNAQGVMGSGVALAIKNKWRAVYGAYMTEHTEGAGLHLGDVIPVQISDELIVINAITQEFCGNDGRKYVSYDAVDIAFKSINTYINSLDAKFRHIHYPMIGAGLGGGDWQVISSIISDAMDDDIKSTLWVKL